MKQKFDYKSKIAVANIQKTVLIIAFSIILSLNTVRTLESKPGINEQKFSLAIDRDSGERYPKKKEGEIVIIFIGDSITEGQGSTERSKDSFAMVLQSMIKNKTNNTEDEDRYRVIKNGGGWRTV